MIRDSAHRHGIDDDDIEPALRNWSTRYSVTDDQGRHLMMYVGPTWSGTLIEIGLNDNGDVVHAMKARPQFIPTNRRR